MDEPINQSINFTKKSLFLVGCLLALFLAACADQPETAVTQTPVPTAEPTAVPPTPTTMPTFDPLPPADFYFGADLSYANELDDCGAVYNVNGVAREPFALFAERGANLVRARLWHNPDWTDYSTLADVTKTFQRARDQGLHTMLTIHYSDDWADPATQNIPAAWKDIEETEALAQAVYDYTREVMLTLNEQGVLPTFVQIGNETNSGMLKRVMELDWPRDVQLFEAGIRAVRDVTAELGYGPQVVLHIAQPENTGWWFREAAEHGLTDFDVIGISYYPQWSRMSISQLGGQISYLRATFGKEIMVVETAYPWTLEAANETAANILNQGLRQYGISVQGQTDFMRDLTQTIINNGGKGVVYWEPAWVSTPCETRWGQGSHWENAAFFDFQNNNELLPSINFLNNPYTKPARLPAGALDERYGAPLLSDATGDNFQEIAHLDLDSFYVTDDADYYYLALTLNGDIRIQSFGGYLIYIDTAEGGANIDVRNRPISVTAGHPPEFRLDISLVEENGTLGGDFVLNAWNGAEWEERPFTGATLVTPGATSLIEWQLPKSLFPDIDTLWLGVVSVGRGRNNTAGDIMGSEPSPQDWSENVQLSTFTAYQATTP